MRIDYGSLSGTQGLLAADDWVDRCRVLGAFDATLHRISNVVVTPTGDGLAVRSYVDALHFITVDGRTLEGGCCGVYLHDLQAGPQGGWRIAGCTLQVAGFPGGGRAAFDAAFEAARGRFSASQTSGR